MRTELAELTEQELQNAIQNYIPHEPSKYELGGDFYYRCGWLACNEPLKRWFDYCPKCGGRIDWEREE